MASHVAVIGGGVSACSFVHLLTELGASQFEVGVFEMGRALGGRLSTRRTREDKRIAIDHGCPFFQVTDARVASVCEQLEREGVLQKVHRDSVASEFRGTNGMNVFCDGLVMKTKCRIHYSTMVCELCFDSNHHKWILTSQLGQPLGYYDWLVVSGNSLAHPRWTKLYGGPPPLVKVAQEFTPLCEGLDRALSIIGALGSSPVTVAMMVYEDALISCESRMVEIQQCRVIAKVVVQRAAGNTVNVTLHSSHEYARGVSAVVGRSSIAAQVGAGDPEKENDILAELMDAAVNIPEVQSNAPLLALLQGKPIWGPCLQRWNNAFPVGVGLPPEHAFVPEAQVVFVGDYVGEATGSVEAAVLSGFHAAEMLNSYVNS